LTALALGVQTLKLTTPPADKDAPIPLAMLGLFTTVYATPIPSPSV
jgi:hypothetical protein